MDLFGGCGHLGCSNSLLAEFSCKDLQRGIAVTVVLVFVRSIVIMVRRQPEFDLVLAQAGYNEILCDRDRGVLGGGSHDK